MALDVNALFSDDTVTAARTFDSNDLFDGGGLFDEPIKPVEVVKPVKAAEVIPEDIPEAKETEEAVIEPVKEAVEAVETASTEPTTVVKTKKTKKAAEPADEEEETSFIHAKFEPQKVSLTAMKKVFTVNFEDPQWESLKADLKERTKNVKIEPEMTHGACRILLAQTTNLLSDLLDVQSENKRFYDSLVDKMLGLIPRQEGLNASGKNEADRKRNSIKSCEEFMVSGKDGKKYNLFDIAGVLFDRIATVDSLIADVKQKKETLVSFLAIFKLEASAK